MKKSNIVKLYNIGNTHYVRIPFQIMLRYGFTKETQFKIQTERDGTLVFTPIRVANSRELLQRLQPAVSIDIVPKLFSSEEIKQINKL